MACAMLHIWRANSAACGACRRAFSQTEGRSVMSKIAFHPALLVAVLVGLLPAAPARAQSIRTFVSQAGTDNPTCIITSPCRHFSAAVNATSLGGEVDALDPGGYGSFTISQAITINGQGWAYVAPPANGAAITINAVTGKVDIRGVALNGVGVANATGIKFTTGGGLSVEDSVIVNFSLDGIDFEPAASSDLSVSNTVISNSFTGIYIGPSGTGTLASILDRVTMANSSTDGLLVVLGTNSATVNVTVSDSVSANNGAYGIVANTNSGGGVISVMVRNCSIVNNVTGGLIASNPSATIRITRSTITGNGAGWTAASSGVVSTFGDNDIFGNGSANNAPASISHE
jgi:hypothetical protein